MFKFGLRLEILAIMAVASTAAAGCGGRQRGTTAEADAERDLRAAVDEFDALCVASGLHEAECRGAADGSGGAQVETSCVSQTAAFAEVDQGDDATLEFHRGCVEAHVAYHRCVLATPCDTLAISEGITLCTAELVGVATNCGDTGVR